MSLTSVYATVEGTTFHFAGLSPAPIKSRYAETDGKSGVNAGQTATVSARAAAR
jgi:hypothetical protein